MKELIAKLKTEIVEQLNLKDVNPEDINEAEPLFGTGLGLDSIDALELIVLLQNNYGIKLKSAEEGKDVFFSVESMAKYIAENRP